MNSLYKILLTLAVIALPFGMDSKASHISGGDISYECVGPNTFVITLNLFRDCSGITMNTSETVTFTSTCGGSVTATLPVIPNPVTGDNWTNISQLCAQDSLNSTCFGGAQPGMQQYTYQDTITLAPPCDTWTMGWSTCCRNTTVNVPTSNGDNVYIEATMNSATNPCNDSPQFTSQPIPYVCINQPVIYNYGVIEPDGDSLVFSLIPGLTGAGANLVYGGGFSGASPIPGITIDPQTGVISFTPTAIGNFIVVVLVEEYDSNGNLLGTVMRDIQFIVQNCSNQVPVPPAGATNFSGNGSQLGPFAFEVCEGDQICFDLTFTDPDATDSLGYITNLMQVLPGATMNIVGANPSTVSICWLAQPGSNPFNAFVMGVDDNACPVSGLTSQTVSVNVINSTYAGPDQIICGTQVAQLQATGGTSFTWSVISGDPIVVGTNFSCNNCDNPVASPAVTTTYEVVSNLSGGCVNIDTVTVSVVPDFTYSLTQSTGVSCLLEDVQLDITTNPTGSFTYDWSPATFLDDATISNPVMTPSSPGTYDYFVDIVSPDGCLKQDTLSVVVNPAYAPDVTAWATDSSIICIDTIDLSVDLGGGVPATCGPSVTIACTAPATTIDVGTNDGANTATTYPAPYGNWFRNARHQMLFTAAELNAMGFVGGKITEVSWEITQLNGTTTYNSYQIYMGCTQTTDLTQFETGLTQVFAPQNVNITTGWNTHVLTTAYEWDGISNLVVEVCYDNLALPFTNNSITPFTNTTFNSCIYFFSDVTPACPSTTGTPATQRPVTRFNTCPTIPDPNQFSYDWNPAAGVVDPTAVTSPASPQVTTTYTVTVTDTAYGCSDTSSVTIIVDCDPCYPPIPDFMEPSCNGGTDGWIAGTPFIVNGPVEMEFIDQSTGQTIQTTPFGIEADTVFGIGAGTYMIQITDTTGCVDDTIITVGEPPAIVVNELLNNGPTCNGDSDGAAEVSVSGGTPGYTYEWVGQNNDSTYIDGLAAGTYTINVTDTNGCLMPYTVTITDPPAIDVSFTTTPATCGQIDGDATAMAMNGTAPYLYQWDAGANNQSQANAIFLGAGTYSVDVVDANGCTGAGTVTVPDTLDLGAQFAATPLEGIAPVDVSFTDQSFGNVDSYIWDFGNGIIESGNAPVPSPTITYDLPGTYTITLVVANPAGCTDTFSLSILIKEESVLVVPNVFTPNGDGMNDQFVVIHEALVTYEMVIFNRWGKEVFRSSNPSDSWDGGDNSDGTYYWMVTATGQDDQVYNLSGNVTLIRDE